MTNRVYNFSAGPAMLPLEVLEASAKALIDYQSKGFGIAECSHRGKEFDDVKLKLINPLRPAILEDAAGDFTYLIMPIRLAG